MFFNIENTSYDVCFLSTFILSSSQVTKLLIFFIVVTESIYSFLLSFNPFVGIGLYLTYFLLFSTEVTSDGLIYEHFKYYLTEDFIIGDFDLTLGTDGDD